MDHESSVLSILYKRIAGISVWRPRSKQHTPIAWSMTEAGQKTIAQKDQFCSRRACLFFKCLVPIWQAVVPERCVETSLAVFILFPLGIPWESTVHAAPGEQTNAEPGFFKECSPAARAM